MAGIATLLGILLIIVAIPFGLMFAPLALGVVVVALALAPRRGVVDEPEGWPPDRPSSSPCLVIVLLPASLLLATLTVIGLGVAGLAAADLDERPPAAQPA